MPEASQAPNLSVTAVVVIWNSPQLAIQTIDSLAEAFPEGLRLVMVDNGSLDDSVERVRAHISARGFGNAVSLVESGANYGFSAGVNLGAAVALAAAPPPAYIWSLNPDAVVEPQTIRELVAVARESGAGITGVAARDRIPNGVRAWPKMFWTTPKGRAEPLDWNKRWLPAGCYNGSCALFAGALVRALIARDGEFLNSSLFLDWDEWDCSLRARELGYSVVLSRDAPEFHDSDSRTLGRSRMAAARQYYQSRNAISVSRRFMSGRLFWATLPLHIGRDFSWFLRLRLKGKRPNEQAYLAGAIDGLRGKSGRWKHHPATPASE